MALLKFFVVVRDKPVLFIKGVMNRIGENTTCKTSDEFARLLKKKQIQIIFFSTLKIIYNFKKKILVEI